MRVSDSGSNANECAKGCLVPMVGSPGCRSLIDSSLMINSLLCWFTPTFVRMHVQMLSIYLTRTHVSLDFVLTSRRLASSCRRGLVVYLP
jgi:hypothetical protein